MRTRSYLSILGVSALALAVAPASQASPVGLSPSYHQVVQDVAGMVGNSQAQSLAGAKGLSILNVMWEDTGRYKGSSVGPNISDVTIEVATESQGGSVQSALMPVIRFPNFHDKTADVNMDHFYIRVGNQDKGRTLRTIKLKDFLSDPTRYMSLPYKGHIKGGSLLASRDSHALVSAQAAFLPIRDSGQATFWPVIFNYQSSKDNPAVLTLLVTRQGTSMTIIDNSRDTVSGGRSWGQRLYFNAGGQRAPLTAERLSTVKQRGVTANGESAASLQQDANLLMLIQVPLKVRQVRRAFGYMDDLAPMAAESAAGAPAKEARRSGSDVEMAVLGHGRAEGPYTELDGLTIERDDRFPVRVTVQFYQATSNGVIDKDNVEALAAQIERVYKSGDYVGSLVTEGHTNRPTEYKGASTAPAGLTWQDFPGLVERAQKYGNPAGVQGWY